MSSHQLGCAPIEGKWHGGKMPNLKSFQVMKFFCVFRIGLEQKQVADPMDYWNLLLGTKPIALVDFLVTNLLST